MKQEYSNTVRAGRILRLLGWINLVLAILFLLALGIPILVEGASEGVVPGFVIMGGLLFLSAFLNLWIGGALKNYKGWARITAVFLSLISLLNFPVGTVISIVVFYYLIKGWDETQNATS